MLSTNTILGHSNVKKGIQRLLILVVAALAFTADPCIAFNGVSNNALKSFKVSSNAGFAPSSSYMSAPQRRARLPNLSLSESTNDDEVPNKNDETNTTPSSDENKKKGGILSKVKSMFGSKPSDGLSTKQRLAKMGLSCFLSYGFVSNMAIVVCVSLSWFGFTKKTGLSPLAPGQWKPFLAVYAGFYVFNNIVRPFRFGLSVGVSHYFDRLIANIQRKTNVSKPIAIGIVVFFVNICGTLSGMALGISLASSLTGVPIFPPKP